MCTLLCSRFAWCLNGRLDTMRPWETSHMKGIVCAPRKFCWHLITKREEWKKSARTHSDLGGLSWGSVTFVTLIGLYTKEAALPVLATQHTHNITNFFFSLAFFRVSVVKQQRWWMSGCPLSLFYSAHLNGPFRDLTETEEKLTPEIKLKHQYSLFFFQTQTTIRCLINIRYIAHSKKKKTPIKCVSLYLTELVRAGKWKSGLEGNQCNQSLLFPHTYFSMFFFPHLTELSHVRPNMWFSLTTALEQLIFSRGKQQQSRQMHTQLFILFTIYGKCLFLGEV